MSWNILCYHMLLTKEPNVNIITPQNDENIIASSQKVSLISITPTDFISSIASSNQTSPFSLPTNTDYTHSYAARFKTTEIEKGNFDRQTYLNRGSIEYYSLYAESETMKLLYSDIVNNAYLGTRFTRSDEKNSTWLGGYTQFSNNAINANDINEILEKVTYDYPILSLYRTGGNNISSIVDYFGNYAIYTDASTDYNIDFQRLYRAVEIKATAIDKEAVRLSGNSIRNYIKALYEEICKDLRYSDDIDDSIHSNDIYGALIEKESKCYGDACAFKYILDKHGIPSFMAEGTVNGERHSWNTIWLDGKWYVCDLTIGADNADGTTGSVNNTGEYKKGIQYAGCLVEQDKYFRQYGAIMDPICYKLEREYEMAIGIEPE